MADQYKIQDPTKQYPKDGIPKQSQPEPGLDKKLQPQADHGEATYRGTERLKGRKALITGGDSGIGRAVAIAYAREGADVALAYLPSEEVDAKEAVKEIEAAGQKAVTIAGDISDEAFCKKLAKEAIRKLGHIDILVNNAGKQVFIEDINDLSTKQLTATFAVNVFSMFWLCKAILPQMPRGSAIINTTSIQAYQPSLACWIMPQPRGQL